MPRLKHILRPHEWIALGAGLGLAATIYMALIHPSLQLVGQESEAAERKNRAERELTQLRTEYQQLQATIAGCHRRLRAVGGSPPLASEKDRQIARVTALAHDCGVKVDQYSPIETVEQTDHQEFLLQFAGRASYEDLLEFFRRLEIEIDFVDVTHFTIAKLQQEAADECQIHWSCRITGMRLEDSSPVGAEPGLALTPARAGPEGGPG